VGAGNATYSIVSVANATSYTWSVPAGATIISGQGTTSIAVSYSLAFTSGSVTVSANNSCGSSTLKTLAISKVLPAMPIAITGPVNACSYVGTASNATYSISAVTGAASYNWTVPTGATIISGQGTTGITVNYSGAFTPGYISVQSVINCGSSAARMLYINKAIPAPPVSISGLVNVCSVTNATYSITAVSGANSYNWAVPSGAIIVSGQGTTSIAVNISNTFTSGNVSVASASNCGASINRTLTITGCHFRSLQISNSADSLMDNDNTLFNIFPNPNDGSTINLEMGSDKEQEILVVVYDILGKENYSKVIITEQTGKNVFAIDPSSKLSQGVYLITATSNQKTYSKKLIVR
jgi:hypothetical protein